MTEQESLWQVPTPLAVWDDYGRVGKGASEAHYILAENGSEYIIKGPSLAPAHPTVAGNEWIAARLASAVGLPLLDYRVVTMHDELFFASSWMPPGTFYPAITEELFNRCENRERAYDLVVFDSWLINSDRHSENLPVRHIARGDRHLLLLNDHSHLLVSPSGPREVGDLMGRLDSPPRTYVTLAFIRDSITDPARINEALDRVERVSDADTRAVVASTPPELLANDARAVYADFLVERKHRLRGLFENHATDFPNLEETS
jgi:hypothetical protein